MTAGARVHSWSGIERYLAARSPWRAARTKRPSAAPALWAAFVAASTLLCTASHGEAQEWLRLDPLRWALTTQLDGTRRSVENSDTTTETGVEAGVRFDQAGSVLDPGITYFSLQFHPKLRRDEFRGAGTDEVSEGELLSYQGTLNIMRAPVFPVGLNADAGRSTSTSDTSLGGRTETETQTLGGSIDLKFRPFRTSVAYSERLLEQTRRSGLTASVSERSNFLRRFQVRGRSQKMNLSYERNWFDDRSIGSDYDYRSQRANFDHRFDWGRGSRLSSRADYFQRRGFNSYETLGLGEAVNITHSNALSSGLSYGYRLTNSANDTETHNGSYSLTHRLYRNLTTTARVRGVTTQSEETEQNNYAGSLDVNYRKRFFDTVNFSIGGGSGYGVTDRRSAGGFTRVVDQSETVPGSGIVLLSQQFIVTSSIVVTDSTGLVVFVEGVDYEVFATRDNFTEIRAIPSGAINPGDTILVSFRFETQPSLKFSTVPIRYHTQLDFGWITLFHRGSRKKQELISGAADVFLEDSRSTTTGVRLRGMLGPVDASASGQQSTQRTRSFSSDTLSFSQSLHYAPSYRVSYNLSSNQDFTESNGRKTDTYRLDLAAFWRPMRNLTLRPRVGAWLREDRGTGIDGTREEQFLTGGLDLEYRIRKITLNFRYTHNRRQGSIPTTDEDRFMLTLVRTSF